MINIIKIVKMVTTSLGGRNMAKMILCRDVGVDCDAAICAETEEGLMRKVAEHAKTVHGMAEIPQDLVPKVKAAIKEV